MQKNLLLLLAVCIFYHAAVAQSSAQKSVKAVMDMQTEEWNKGNIVAFMQTYWKNDSLMFIGKNGVTYGWQKALDNYKKHYPDTAAMGHLNFELVEVKELSSTACFVVGKWFLTRTIGNVNGAFTLLLRKINGRWLIVADHSS